MFRSRQHVPFKPQHADSDCGAACLAMVLAHYGEDASIFTIRRLCESFGPPESTRAIIAAARSRGLETNLVASDVDGLGEVALPCILYWKFCHFVVLNRITKHGYDITDPSFGRRTVKPSEFDKCYTGIAIALRPGPAFSKRPREQNQRFRSFLRSAFSEVGGWRLLGLLALASFVLQTLSLIMPLATVYIVDSLVPANLEEAMVPLLGVILLLGVNVATLSLARSRLILSLQSIVDAALLRGYMSHLLSLPLRYFSDRSTAEIQGRMNSNTVIRDLLSTYTVTGILDVGMAVSYLLVLALASPLFAGLTLLLAALQLATYLFSLTELRERVTAEIRMQANYQAFVAETINGIATIKGAGAEDNVEKAWATKLENITGLREVVWVILADFTAPAACR